MNEFFNILAYSTNIVCCFLYLPQVLHTYRSGSADDISTIFLITRVSISISNLVYAYGLISTFGTDIGLPLVFSQSMIFICSGSIIYMKFYKRNGYDPILV